MNSDMLTGTAGTSALDRDGGVLLSVARDSTGQTLVSRIDNPSPVGSRLPTVAGISVISTAITSRPLIDRGTYWFIGTNASDRTPDVRQPTSLSLRSASWTDVGAFF